MSEAWRAYGTGTYGGSGGEAPQPPTPPAAVVTDTPYGRLLRLTCTIRHRNDTVDAHGDVITDVDVTGPHPCHAYQRYREEMVDGRLLGFDELVVHLMADTPVDQGDRVDVVWPDQRTLQLEVAGPPARRVRARTGQLHHIELRGREVR